MYNPDIENNAGENGATNGTSYEVFGFLTSKFLMTQNRCANYELIKPGGGDPALTSLKGTRISPSDNWLIQLADSRR